MKCENVKNQHGAVYDFGTVQIFFQIADLGGSQFTVKYHQTDLVFTAECFEFFDFAASDYGSHVRRILILNQAGKRFAAGGVQKAGKLIKALFHFRCFRVIAAECNQNRAAVSDFLFFHSGSFHKTIKASYV